LDKGAKEKRRSLVAKEKLPLGTSSSDIMMVSGTEYVALRGKSREVDELRREVRRLNDNNARRERRKNAPKPIPVWAAVGIESLPEWMREAAKEIAADASMRDTMRHVLERQAEFKSPTAAVLVGIGMDQRARAHLDKLLDKKWAETDVPKFSNQYNEIVVGGGLHAAIYAATRARMGMPRVLVVEKTSHPGGVFACSRGPGFYLNSRNRPGVGPSRPGDQGPLNFLPGCLVQPADMGGEEYQTNDVIAWVIRVNLALYADVLPNTEVNQVNGVRLYDKRKELMRARLRIIFATGFGPTKKLAGFDSDRYLTFEQFIATLDKPFPMQGMNRVAVIGAGDSGKCVIEALTGQGPSMLTAISLDYPEIDWYGVPENQRSRQAWEECNRTRYKGIGHLLRDNRYLGDEPRVTLRGTTDRGSARTFERGLDCVYVDGRPYDLAIDCTGYLRSDAPTPNGPEAWGPYGQDSGGSSIAGEAGYAFTIGPCAKIRPSESDSRKFRRIGENGTSIFYLARKTESLALQFN